MNGPWFQVHGGCISGADIAAWPYSVGILLKLTAFLGSLYWPVDAVDLGHFGVWCFFFGTSDPFLSNGLDTGCSAKKRPGLMVGLTVPF